MSIGKCPAIATVFLDFIQCLVGFVEEFRIAPSLFGIECYADTRT